MRASLAAVTLASVCIVVVSLFVGDGDLCDPALRDTLLGLRATRMGAAFLAGAALAVGGVVLQTLFRNPLVDPSVLGTAAGAILGGQLAIATSQLAPRWAQPAGLVPEMVQSIGCLGGALAALAILLTVVRRTRSLLAVLLTGFLLSAMFLSVGALLVSLAQDAYELGRAVVAFTLGGVGGTGARHLLLALPLVLAAVIALWCWARPLELMLSREDEATTLGVDVPQLRLWVVVWVAVGTAGAVAIGGSVGFVGLIVPHVLRPLLGVGLRRLLPAAAITGGAFVVLCDMAVRAAPLRSELPLGVITGLIGGPRAGKTTLLRAIAGLVQYEGVIAVDGIDARSFDHRSRARHISYVPQQPRLDSPLAVFDVVAQGRYAHRDGLSALKLSDRSTIEEALRRVDALGLAARSFLELSHGERRRVLIARALATGASLVLLDEPVASLDVRYALACFRIIRDLAAAGGAVVVALHDLDHALRFCDAAVLLERGNVVAHGAASKVITAPLVSRVYGIELVPGGAVGFREAP